MEVLEIPKNPQFFCEKCKYITNNKKDYIKHLSTAKHKNGSILEVKNPKKSPKTPNFECECGRNFITHSGMWKHKQKCLHHNTSNTIKDTTRSKTHYRKVLTETRCRRIYTSRYYFPVCLD